MNNKKRLSKIIILGVVSTIISSNFSSIPVSALEVNDTGVVEASSNSEDEELPANKFSYSTSTSENFARILGGSLNSTDMYLNLPTEYSYKPIGIIGDNAFANNNYIISAKLPDTVTTIGAGAFLTCRNLRKVNMPEKLESIGKSAFQGTEISEVTFPKSLISIGCTAFAETPIKSIYIPANTIDIDGAAFAGSDLSEITVDEANEKYISENQMIITKDKSTIVSCAPTVTEPIFDSECSIIGENSFALGKVIEVKIPNTIKEIGIAAFEGCLNLTSVVLPKDLKEIKEQVFCGCDNLTSVVISDNVESIADDAFKYCDKLTIIAPEGSYAQKYANEKGISFRDISTIDNPYKEKKAIIVIPGIAGSRLYSPIMGLVWEPPIVEGPVNLYLKIKNIRLLGYDLNGNSVENVSPYTVDGSIVDKVDKANEVTLSGFGTEGTYSKLVLDLKQKYGAQYDDIVYFPYEWRNSNTDAAEKLQDYIEQKGYTNVTLVAHSMGGIVASKYIKNGNKDKVDKLITIGTPYFGAPKALYVFETGHFLDGILSDPLTFKEFKAISNTIPSIYELLPNKYYFSNYPYITDSRNGKELNYDETNKYISSKKWCFTNYLKNSEKLYDSIISDNGVPVNDVDSYVIVGENVKTINGLKINKNGNIEDDTDKNPSDGQYIDDMDYVEDIHISKKGDGTVPLLSSVMKGMTLNRKPYYVDGVEHGDLPANASVIKLVEAILNGAGDNDLAIKEAQSGNKISRSVKNNKTSRSENENLDSQIITKFTVDGDANIELKDKKGEVIGTSADTSKYENSFYYCGKDNCKKILFLDEEEMQNSNDVSVIAASDGKINYSIETYNEDNTLEQYDFKDIPVSKDSKITCEKLDDKTMQLKVDKNNDNKPEMYSEIQNKTVVTDITQLNKYTVKFVSEDGQNICDNQIIEQGKAAIAPEAPFKEGYTFKGWNKTFDNVNDDLVVKPIYEEIKPVEDDKPIEGDKPADGNNNNTSDPRNILPIMGIILGSILLVKTKKV